MNLLDFFKEKKFAGCDGILIRPHIPSKSISNAVGAYSVRVDPKEIVVLIDDTAFGSAKDGILICEDRLVVRAMFSSAIEYEYEIIDSISCENRKLYINEQEALKLNIPGKHELSAFFELLDEWLKLSKSSGFRSGADHLAGSSAPDTNMEISGFGDFLFEAARKVISDKVYVRPNIPHKKLQAAIGAYGEGIAPEDVIILVDDTAFGSAKDGMLITNKSIYIKIFTESLRAYEWKFVESIKIEKSTVYINDAASGSLVLTAAKDLGQLFNKIDEVISNQVFSGGQSPSPATSAPARAAETELTFNVDEALSVENQHKSELKPERALVVADKDGESIAEANTLARDTGSTNASANKLASHVAVFIADNKSKILPLLKQKAGDTSLAALQDDANIERLASYIYGRLPSVVKLAVSETVFSQFMLKNREQLLSKLLIEEQCPQDESVVSAGDTSAAQEEAAAIASIVEAEVSANHPADEHADLANTAVPMTAKDSKAKDKLLSYVSAAIEQNKSKIIPLIKEKTGEASLAALRDDSNVEKLAIFIYAFLPGVLRLALKEPVFIRFMIDNRDKLIEKFVQDNPLDSLEVAQEIIFDFEGGVGDQDESASDGESKGDEVGYFVFSIFDKVVESFLDDGIYYPELKFGHDLAVNNLSALVSAANDLRACDRGLVESQAVFMLSFMYGFSYYKIPDDLKSNSMRNAYFSMLYESLERYKKYGGGNLVEVHENAIENVCLRLSSAISKEIFNIDVKRIMAAHSSIAKEGYFSVEDVVLLLKKASGFSMAWVNGFVLEKNTMESDLQNKMEGLLD
jgi:hypothetical protein